MRNLRLLGLLAPVLLLPAIACEEDPNAGTATFNPIPSPTFVPPPTPEAGPVAEAGTDAGATDAAVDSFVPPAGVTVTVIDQGLPKNMVRVILHDATGAVTGDVKTDATGKVTIATAPSMVTVLTSEPGVNGRVAPITFMSVAAGDNLVVATPIQYVSAPAIGTYNVPFTSSALVQFANSIDLVAGRGCYAFSDSIATPGLIGLRPECVNPANAPNAILATAYDDNEGRQLLGYGFAKNVAKPAAMATVNVPALGFTAPGATKVTASDLPQSQSHTYNVRLFAIANGGAFGFGDESGTITDPNEGVTFPTATGFGEAYQSYVHSEPYSPSIRSYQAILRREASVAPAAATLTNSDFSTALPLITNATVTAPTAARPDFTITPAASLAGADGGVVRLGWYLDDGNESSGSWTFVVPASTMTFKAPALPADATGFVLQNGADLTVDDVAFFEASQLPSYKELKALPVAPGSGLDLVNESVPLPSAGTVRITRRTSSNRVIIGPVE